MQCVNLYHYLILRTFIDTSCKLPQVLDAYLTVAGEKAYRQPTQESPIDEDERKSASPLSVLTMSALLFMHSIKTSDLSWYDVAMRLGRSSVSSSVFQCMPY